MADAKPGDSKSNDGKSNDKGTSGAVGFILIVVVGVAIGSFVTRSNNPPAAVTGAAIAEARAKVLRGDRTGAALAYSKVIDDAPDSGDAKEAREELSKLAAASVAAGVPLADAALVLATARDVAAIVKSDTVADACLRASAEASKDPKGACELTRVLSEMAQGPEVQGARTAALDAAIAKDANDLDAQVARAEVELDMGDFKKAETRLAPFASKLGDGDGARALGLALSQLDGEDRALPLLKAYFDAHIDSLNRALAGLKAADMTVRNRVVDSFRAGEFSPAFKRQMDEADQDTRKKLMDAWVRERTLRDRTVKTALKAVLAARKIVEPAIVLGGIEVKLAAEKAAERRAHLESAERYYLAILEIAAGDSQLLFVARVRFDLGRDKEAREILEQLYQRHGRPGEFLLGLAVAFQRVGPARETVRELSEEAHGKLVEPQLKEKAAAIRASVAPNTADAVVWLERAGSDPRVRTTLAQGRAQVARDDGRFEDAKKHVDEAISLLVDAGKGAPPEQIATLRMERFATSGERSDLDACIATLEKASGPQARRGTLALLADALLTRAILDVVKDRVRTDVVRERSLELFHFAAKDEKDLDALIGLLTAHPDRLRALEVRERTIALDATRQDGWEGVLADASARRDLAAVESLAERIGKAPIDRTEERRELADYWAGRSDGLYRESIARKRKHADALLALARRQGDPATIARALVARGSIERDAPGIGVAADQDLGVARSAEAHELSPRPFTQVALQQALLARALDRARRSSKGLDDLEKDHGKLGAPVVLSLAVRSDPALADALSKDEDVKRAAALVPDEGEPQTLYLTAVTLARSPARDALVKRLASSKLAIARARASIALTPESPECVMEIVTVLEARGEKDEAARIVERAKKDGVALPYDMLR